MNKTHFVLGGDLKRSLTEGYTIDFKQTFKDAFTITRSNYLPLAIACTFTVSIVVFIFSLNYEFFLSLSEPTQILVNLLFSSFFITPLVTGLLMMGINHSVGLKTRSFDLFRYFNIILKLALASLIMNIVVLGSDLILTQLFGSIGQKLSIIVMLYFNVVFSMVYPLIAEKKIDPMQSVKLSFRLINKNLLQFTLLFMLLGTLAVIATLPSGIGLFFFIPFYFNVMGIIYRQICGVGVVATAAPKSDDDDNQNDDDSGSGKTDNSKNSSEFEA